MHLTRESCENNSKLYSVTEHRQIDRQIEVFIKVLTCNTAQQKVRGFKASIDFNMNQPKHEIIIMNRDILFSANSKEK